MINRLADLFARLPDAERRRWHGVLLCVALYLFHAVWFSTWLIEDAAISFGYAQNFARGDGLVTWVGGEWVEGFSNPTWTLLLAFTSWLGLSPWAMAKLLGVGAGALTLPLAYLWARRLQPDAPGMWPVLAPLVLALSTQFTLWTASGLENGLFDLLLTAAAVRLLVEGERPSSGWMSGGLLGLLAITRPEGPMYAGLIAGLGAGWALRAGGTRWALGFVFGGLAPFLGWHAWRFQKFAWELPNTYYAKQTEHKFAPWSWDKLGWNYLRGWALASTHGFLLPLFTLGQSGLRGWAGVAGLALTGMLVGLLIPGIGWLTDLVPFPREPELAVSVRIGALVAGLFVFPLLGFGRQGSTARWMAWGTMAAALFFAVYTGGDWMRGFRWLNMASVPLAVLLADGARGAAEGLQPLIQALRPQARRMGWVALALVLPALGGGVGQTIDFLFGIETSPYDVRRRVLYMRGVQERLHVDRVSLLEVDMGAHMIWSGFQLFDLAGLCDVPMARHHYQRPFIDAYLHDEHRPSFAHLHGSWAKRTNIVSRPWFDTEYLEIPGYGHSFTQLHIGNHIRRDLFIQSGWTGRTDRRTLFGELTLEGLETPAPTVAPGGGLYVEIGWSIQRRTPNFRALLFLTNGEHTVVRDLPPAYDWLPVPQWRAGQVVLGRHTLSLPEDLPPGRYDLGVVVIDEGVGGRARRGLPVREDGAIDLARVVQEPRYMAGEARWDGVIEVRPRAEVAQTATLAFGRAVLTAREGSCEQAEASWSVARRYLPPADPWHADVDPAWATEAARCWARRAAQDGRASDILAGRVWDPRDPELRRVGVQLADRLEAEGDAAMAAGDEDGAWQGWTDTLVADPTRSWVRRRVEGLRITRLGLEELE